jgi:glutathione peroxidase
MSSIHSISARTLDGKERSLGDYTGKVVLIVNTASECGFTPQYEGLEALSKKYAGKDLVVLGFPSNDFGGQEPGTSEEIATFCQKNYGVSFPMFEKAKVVGAQASPLFKLLGEAKGEPKWNFHKYLVAKDGTVLAAFPSAVKPDDRDLVGAIETALSK